MTSSKDSPIYFVLTFFTQRSHLFCFDFWWVHMIVYMPSGHGCACTSTFMHMHGVWRTISGMLLLRYYLVSVRQESLTDLGLTWFSCPALLANSGDPLRYLQDYKDLAPHFHRHWGVNSDSRACTGSTLLTISLFLFDGSGFPTI